MSNDLIEKASEIANEYLKYDPGDPIHGMPHINQVHEYYELLEKDLLGEEQEKLLRALELSVKLHDIGNYSRREQHGAESIKILRRDHCKFLSEIPKQIRPWVIYTINYHSNPDCEHNMPPDKAVEEKDICLSLLMLLDHMDAIGKIGVRRAIMDMGDKYVRWIPNDKDFKKLEEIKLSDRECLKKSCQFKNRSLLDHLFCNYYYIEKNLDRVKDRIKEDGKFLEEYQKLSNEQIKYINLLKNNKKLNTEEIEELDEATKNRFK